MVMEHARQPKPSDGFSYQQGISYSDESASLSLVVVQEQPHQGLKPTSVRARLESAASTST